MSSKRAIIAIGTAIGVFVLSTVVFAAVMLGAVMLFFSQFSLDPTLPFLP